MDASAAKLGTVAVIGIYATFALDCYSTFCSSPQTTELNAHARAETLMKWVAIGGGVAVAGGIAASMYSDSPGPFIGAASISALMYVMYLHAKNEGLKNGGRSTERY